jgi:uncharacterized protein (DUF1778 family)
MGKNQHVVPHEGGWAVRGEGNSRATSIHPTQGEAIQAATEIAVNQQSEVLIHGRDGRVRGRNGHSHAPSPSGGDMASETGSEMMFELRLPSALKEVLEQAAAHLGQSVDEFAVGVLARTAREVIELHGETVLTGRDWERFLVLLDDLDAEPSPALKAAAARYEQHLD